MRVLLVSTYELGHQPLHVASPAGALRAAGHEVRAVDLAVEDWDGASVDWAEAVAFSVPMHTAARLARRAAAGARRRRPGIPIAVYGLYATIARADDDAVAFDRVIAGEFEPELVAWAGGLARARGTTVDLGRYAARPAPPARDLLPPLDRYARAVIDGDERAAGYVEASRGCAHRCRHCPVPVVYDGRTRIVAVDAVLDDVEQLVAAGARHVTFGDPDFLNGPGHALDVARRLHAEWPGLTFDFTAKVEHLLKHRRLLPELASLGCTFVVSAVESLSDEVLRRLDKGHTAADVGELLRVMDAAGVVLHPTLVAFTPWTTLDDYIACVELFRGHGLVAYVPPVQLAIRLLVPPHSALLADPDAASWVGPLDPEAFTHRWTHPDPRMDALHERVASCVEAAEDAGDDPRATWDAVRALAYEAAGRPLPDEALPPEFRPDPPRLTEHWFC